MSQFEPISGKKLRVFPEARFLKYRYIFFEAENKVVRILYKYYTLK
jgi:hypothetical protein